MDTMIGQEASTKLAVFRRQYLQLIEPTQLKWPESHILKIPEVQSWMFQHLFDRDQNPNLPPDRYRLRVLKALISKLERAISDPEEDVGLTISFRSICQHLFESMMMPGQWRPWFPVGKSVIRNTLRMKFYPALLQC